VSVADVGSTIAGSLVLISEARGALVAAVNDLSGARTNWATTVEGSRDTEMLRLIDPTTSAVDDSAQVIEMLDRVDRMLRRYLTAIGYTPSSAVPPTSPGYRESDDASPRVRLARQRVGERPDGS
jgi:hypothetical protein